MKTHYSVAELLALELEGLPKTQKGLDKFLARNGFEYKEIPSRGKGGMRKEYELPNDLMTLVVLKGIKQELNVAEPTMVTKTELSTVIDTQQPTELMNWQREIAENRLFIVRYLQSQINAGAKKTPAIQTFIEQAYEGALPADIQHAVSKANAKSGENRVVSRRSIFDWMKTVEDAEKHQISVIAVLAPKQRQTVMPAWAGALLKVWSQPQKPMLTVCLEMLPQYLDAGVKCPSYAQAYRFLNEKMGKVDVMRGQMGARELKNIRPFIRRDTSLLLPTDVYTADGHCFDAEVAHPAHGKPFRPEITSILDVATRRLVGWSISLAESSWCVLDAIRIAAVECGIPALFYVDNGSGYKNDMLKAQNRGVMARLNTEVTHALPYNSQAKGMIERSHQTLWVTAAKKLPTYMGKDMDSEAGNAVFKLTRKDIAEFGQSKLLMSWPDFVAYAAQVINEYNNKPHSGLKRVVDPVTLKKRYQTPLEAWNEALEQGAPIDRVEDWDAEDLFRPYEARKVRRGEIELFGNRYFNKDLEQYHGVEVLVGYDIHSAEKVVVRDEDGRLICHATWNANKRNYFPVSKVEQARQNRADGRLRRLAVKQAEVFDELSPKAMIEHIENQNVIPFDQLKRQKLMAELDALPVQPKPEERVYFKDVELPQEDEKHSGQVFSTPLERWMNIDKRVLKEEEVSEKDQDFWNMFQMSKKFKQLSLDDETLKTYLERRQVS
ncbi:Mu transposase C-terminal domain-containing protein [Acinetobacter ursingii]|uniref:Mu transposase C-terminal domain-containing protein n=2 Tax=Moraxellaceae TaxID=468 RepID=UPI00124BEB47|nr:Mu transposase C-terminal domain-containing protein [Acinetobacter ursingii]MCU4587440.1 Mu transposase C-terminal domain-containing protein [Acinetobacter ursingii]